MYFVELSKQAKKDKKFLKAAGLERKAKSLLISIIESNPFQTPPAYEKLFWDLRGSFSRRLNDQHRIVYDIVENAENLLDPNGIPYEGIVRVKRM